MRKHIIRGYPSSARRFPGIHTGIHIISSLALSATLVLLLVAAAGCTSSPPDTSAPQRQVIDRTADWQGALLYIADQDGPVPEWGSIRIYDNVSGFVEESIEQTSAAGPADVYVTPDGSSMYVASIANGRIDEFRWDGRNWNRSGNVIDSPAASLLTLSPGPDGMLYAADGTPGSGDGRLYVLDPESGSLAPEPLTFDSLEAIRGIAWNHEGTRAYVSGSKTSGAPVLLDAAWPAAAESASVELPLQQANKAAVSPDGSQVFVMGNGGIARVDAASMTVIGTWNPAGQPGIVYYDAAFSADGVYMFTAGTDPASDSTLYVIDLRDGSLVHSVNHVSRRANGILRVE